MVLEKEAAVPVQKLTKTTLVDAVAERTGMTKTKTKKVLDVMLEVITETLTKEERLVLTGFGTFETRHAKERWGVNPRTRERILIPATKRPAFSAGASLKRKVADS